MIQKITALLDGLSIEDLDRASPAQRQQFAQRCAHWLKLAERRCADDIVEGARTALEPKSGILRDLKRGQRSE
jgi:hypothetical protein